MGPSRMGGPTRWTPGTFPVVPVQYLVNPETFSMAETELPIYKHLQTIPELLVTSGTPNNIRVTAYTYPYNPSVTEP